MNLFKAFTQGGQVTLHNLRMIRQVISITLSVTGIMGILFFCITCWGISTPYQRNLALSYGVAYVSVHIIPGNVFNRTQIVTHPNGKSQRVHSLDLLHHPAIQSEIKILKTVLWQNLIDTLWIMVGTFSLFMGF